MARLGPRRALFAFVASSGIHALAGCGLALLARLAVPSTPPLPATTRPVESAIVTKRPPPPPPSADELRREVRARRRWLGEALILRAGLDRNASEKAITAYRALLEVLRTRLPRERTEIPRTIIALLRERELDAYRALNHDLGNALLRRGGDCRARTELVVALLYDLGLGQHTGARAFANHLAPYFRDGKREHHFGLVASCTGLGVPVGPLELLEDGLPQATDRCREERPLMGTGLRDDDPEPAWSGKEPSSEEPCPLAEWPWREPGDEVFLERDSLPVQRLDVPKLELLNHAAGMECHARRVASVRAARKSTDRLLAALGQAVGYGEEAALELVAGGELDTARSAEEQTRAWYREAETLLEHWDPSGVPLRAELSSLIHLGPRGQGALFALVPHHLCWVGSDLLAILVREPATRERALALYLTRTLPQQIEAADRMYWTDGAFQHALERHPAGRRALILRAVINAARSRWKSCRFDELVRAANDTAREAMLDRDWVAPLVAVLAEDAHVHLADHHCPVERFTAPVRAWGAGQPGEIRAWLGRQTREP